jgi:hypothetical protein
MEGGAEDDEPTQKAGWEMRSQQDERDAFESALKGVIVADPQLAVAVQSAGEYRSGYPGLPEGFATRDCLVAALKVAIDGFDPDDRNEEFAVPVELIRDGGLYEERFMAAAHLISDAVVAGFFSAIEDGGDTPSDRLVVRDAMRIALLRYVSSYRENLAGDLG